ncbi:hypothetical protein [Stakelama flava]|uniref:hypothetical protein n=1 Tax=Stakelama flava TaxID=2860338 RepID=UPI0031BA8B4E
MDASGVRLRLGVENGPAGLQIALERSDLAAVPLATLDIYGAELLCGFIMAARLAGSDDLAEEQAWGANAATFALLGSARRIEIVQNGSAGPVSIPATLWDRLFAELCIVAAHGRAVAEPGRATLH